MLIKLGYDWILLLSHMKFILSRVWLKEGDSAWIRLSGRGVML